MKRERPKHPKRKINKAVGEEDYDQEVFSFRNEDIIKKKD